MNYYAVVFLLRPPNLLRRGPFLRKNVCNSQEDGVRTRCAAIVNQPAVLKILRVVNLLRVVFFVRRGPLGKCEMKSSHLVDFRVDFESNFGRFLADLSQAWPILAEILRPKRGNSLTKSRWQKERVGFLSLGTRKKRPNTLEKSE